MSKLYHENAKLSHIVKINLSIYVSDDYDYE